MISSGSGRSESGWRILIAGTGGQGVLTAARVLCDYFAGRGHNVVSGQLHGMAQRGGSVQSSVIIDCGNGPVIGSGRAGCVVGFEPVETARALPLMSSRTLVCMNTAPVVPYILGQRFVSGDGDSGYPNVNRLFGAIGAVTRHAFQLDATRLAVEAGSGKALNMVMLGCMLGYGFLPCPVDGFWSTVEGKTPPALARINRRAFWSGVEMGRGFRPAGARE